MYSSDIYHAIVDEKLFVMNEYWEQSDTILV